MAVTESVVLLLALLLRGGSTLYTSSNDSRLLAVLNASAPALDVLLHIDVLAAEKTSLSTAPNPPSSDLKSIIRAEVNGDWERGRSVLYLATEAHTLELKHAIYEALWQELQQTRQFYDPLKVLEFQRQLEKMPDVPPQLLENVYQAFVSRSAQLLSAPFHTTSRSAEFPLVASLMQRLTLSTLDYLRDILEALFDAVLALESTLSVVERLGNFSASLNQLTLANLQLLKRTELKRDVEAQTVVQRNLRQLLEQPNFEQEVELLERQQLYEQLPTDERILYTAQKVCLRNMTDANAYIYECPQTYLICTNARDPKKATYYVQRGYGGANNTLQFAFYSAYWRNRYILMEPSNHSVGNIITKNVYSRNALSWWHVVRSADGGVSLYDAATSRSVLCGGDPEHWDGEERHVYTRNAQEFAAHRRECVWSIEDCSDVA